MLFHSIRSEWGCWVAAPLRLLGGVTLMIWRKRKKKKTSDRKQLLKIELMWTIVEQMSRANMQTCMRHWSAEILHEDVWVWIILLQICCYCDRSRPRRKNEQTKRLHNWLKHHHVDLLTDAVITNKSKQLKNVLVVEAIEVQQGFGSRPR